MAITFLVDNVPTTGTSHELKCHPGPYAEMSAGRKVHEWRRDDREPRYAVGDTLMLLEYDPATGTYSGAWTEARVTSISRGPEFGIPEGYCVMSIRRTSWEDAPR